MRDLTAVFGLALPELHSGAACAECSLTADNRCGLILPPVDQTTPAQNTGRRVARNSLPSPRSLVRLGAAAIIPEMLQELGISANTALNRAGLSRRALAHPGLVVPLNRVSDVFRSAQAASGQPEFGLLVGLRAASRRMGFPENLVPRDTQVTAVLMRVIARPAMFPHILMTLSVGGPTSMVGCISLPDTVVGRIQIAECTLGFAAGLLRALCGPQRKPQHFYFAHGPPSDASRYTALLQAPVLFGADVNGMQFASMWPPHEHVSARGFASASAYSVATEDRLHEDTLSKLRTVLSDWNAIERPSAPAVSAKLGLQTRALNRLLKRRGTSFNLVFEAVQYENARRMLLESTVAVVSVAWSLGYPDASAFSRAFRRWSGMTPTEWRKRTNDEV